jgi:hypothetical protein
MALADPAQCLALLAIARSTFAGARPGDQRTGSESTRVAEKVGEQFELGVDAARRYDWPPALIRDRLEPDYPGSGMLAQVLSDQHRHPTSSTTTPTPDLRNSLFRRSWAIDALLAAQGRTGSTVR